MVKTKNYLNSQIITYLGNKRKIISYIEEVIVEIKKNLNKDNIRHY